MDDHSISSVGLPVKCLSLRMVHTFRWEILFGGLPRCPRLPARQVPRGWGPPALRAGTAPEPPESGALHALYGCPRVSRRRCEPHTGAVAFPEHA